MAQDIPWEEQSSGGKKVYRVKQSQSCYLSSCFGRCSGEVVTSVIIGQDKQVIVAWPVSCLVGLCCFLGQFQSLVLKGLSSVPTFLDSKVAAGQNGLEQRQQYKMETDAKLFSCSWLICGPK
jgi:hypothetical protein